MDKVGEMLPLDAEVDGRKMCWVRVGGVEGGVCETAVLMRWEQAWEQAGGGKESCSDRSDSCMLAWCEHEQAKDVAAELAGGEE